MQADAWSLRSLDLTQEYQPIEQILESFNKNCFKKARIVRFGYVSNKYFDQDEPVARISEPDWTIRDGDCVNTFLNIHENIEDQNINFAESSEDSSEEYDHLSLS